jgi:hypothetical protein
MWSLTGNNTILSAFLHIIDVRTTVAELHLVLQNRKETRFGHSAELQLLPFEMYSTEGPWAIPGEEMNRKARNKQLLYLKVLNNYYR